MLIYGKETLYGVIGAVPPHLQKAEDYKQAPKIEELLIDTGYDRETLRTLVDIGTPVGFYEKTAFLLGSRICGRSMDNKACCAAAVLGAAGICMLPCQLEKRPEWRPAAALQRIVSGRMRLL